MFVTQIQKVNIWQQATICGYLMLGMPTKKHPCQKYKVLQTWHRKALNSWLTSVYINLIFQSKFSAAKIKHDKETDKETPHDDVTEGTFEWRGVGNNVKHYLSYSVMNLYWADSLLVSRVLTPSNPPPPGGVGENPSWERGWQTPC